MTVTIDPCGPLGVLLPKVIPLGEPVRFTMSPAASTAVRLSAAAQAGRWALFESGLEYDLDIMSVRDFRARPVQRVGVGGAGALNFTFEPSQAGEHRVGVYAPGRKWQEDPLWSDSFFVVPEGWIHWKPYRGDLHLHTHYSDGRASPLRMVVRARELGMDFAAVTDHRVYDSSLEAAREAGRKGIDILLLAGEEVNYCLGLGHLVSLGARECVSEKYALNGKTADGEFFERLENFETLLQQVYQGVADELEEREIPQGADRRLFGFVHGLVKKIHECGGIAVGAHPFWSSHGTMDLVRSTYEAALEAQLFDAVEVFGGMSFEENMLSLSRIQQSRETGLRTPLLGSSDAHRLDAPEMGRIWTLLYAPELSEESVLSAIREGRTCPCLVGEQNRVIAAGSFPLVEYSYFLLREFFPEHDRICRRLGALYAALLRDKAGPPKGEKRLRSLIRALQREAASLYDTFFAAGAKES